MVLDVRTKCKSFGHKGDKCEKVEEVDGVKPVKDTGESIKLGEVEVVDTDWEIKKEREHES